MVYYIIACHKENQDEKTVHNMVTNTVLRDGNRQLGSFY